MSAARPTPGRVVDALGVAVRLTVAAERVCRHLPRATTAAVAALDPDDDADPVRAVTRIAVDQTAHLAVHAGVVAVEGGAVAFPGRSGAGKSTLVAACVQAGLPYLCDEVLAVDRVTGAAVPFARPIALEAGSRRLLDLDDDDAGEVFVDPEALGTIAPDALPVRHVVIPRRRAGAATLSPLSAADGLRELLPRCFNHFREPAASWQQLSAMCTGAQIWEASYEDARELASLLATRWYPRVAV